MGNELIKMFCVNIKHDYSLYEMFLKGTWYPNFDEYRLFLNKINKNNINFAKTIERYNLVKKNDFILETSLNKEYTVLDHLNREGKVIESKYGKFKVDRSLLDNVDYNTCYISNGIYEDTFFILENLINRASFIIGICDNDKSTFFENNMKLIEKEEKFLRKVHAKYKVYKHNNHRDKTYILYSRRGL